MAGRCGRRRRPSDCRICESILASERSPRCVRGDVPTATVPEQGQLVEVRERRWVVADVDAGELPQDAREPARPRQHLVTLRSVEDDAEPSESLQVVWELEPGARAFERAGLP